MKAKWLANWWCDKIEATKERGFHTHEELMTFVEKQKHKGIRVMTRLRKP